VSDLALPDEDGCWLMRGMRAATRSGTRPPATVIVTANNEDGAWARCRLAGCEAFLAKPVDADDLCGVVARLASDPTLPPRRLGEPVRRRRSAVGGE
jgi:CheY-like chemotaxis protein